MNCNRLANGLVDWVFDVQFFQGVVTRVENTKNTYYTIMINFIITQIKGQKLIMGKQDLCDHHCAVSLDFILIQVKVLKT